MQPARGALLIAMDLIPELRDLPLAVGKSPERQPPSVEAIFKARVMVADALGVNARSADERHYAGEWRHNMVGAVQKKCNCLDKVLPAWLKRGSPMGIL